MRSSSSGQDVGLAARLRESAFYFSRYLRERGPFAKADFTWLERDLEEYRSICADYGGFELDEARVFEIGCGQRPMRLLYLTASGVEVRAADLDMVVLDPTLGDLAATWRTNGAERAVKTAVRYVTSDIFENRRVKAHLQQMSGDDEFSWPYQRIHQGSAAKSDVWPTEPVDFVYSEDVFEHIPAEELPAICEQIAANLSDRGLAMIRPNCFTGIQGGHHIDYTDLSVDRERRCPPWDHLREYHFPANTYLNGLYRADYRELFAKHFEILDETVKYPDKGKQFMTEALRQELGDYPDEELYSNQVRWVLKPG